MIRAKLQGLVQSIYLVEVLLLVTAVALSGAMILLRLTVPVDSQSMVSGSLSWMGVLLFFCIISVKARHFLEERQSNQLINELEEYVPGNMPLEPDGTSFSEITTWVVDSVRSSSSREYAIADYARDILCSFTAEFKVAAINSTSERLLGFSSIELLGKSLTSIIAESDNTRLQRVLEEARTSKRPVDFELRLLTRQGSVIDTAWYAEWSETEQLFFSVARDISAAKAQERARQELIAMISHDVRSPLSSVLLGVTAFSRGLYGEMSERATNALSRMESNITRIVDLLTELIDLEKSESELKLDRSDFDVRELTAEVIEQLSDLSSQLEVTVENKTESVLINADRKRIYRVLLNLLSNAIKHSDIGKSISIYTKTSNNEIEINVEDHGPGIPEHLQQAVFERFVQLELPVRSGVPSSGLGLTICKTFVEAHNCFIGVRSQPGVGSTFWFSLPLASAKRTV